MIGATFVFRFIAIMGNNSVNIEDKSDDDPEEIKYRKKRISFSSKQILELECIYSRNSYPNIKERMEIADLLNVPSESVNIWFKNKRSKITKEKKNLVCIFFFIVYVYKTRN